MSRLAKNADAVMIMPAVHINSEVKSLIMACLFCQKMAQEGEKTSRNLVQMFPRPIQAIHRGGKAENLFSGFSDEMDCAQLPWKITRLGNCAAIFAAL